MIWTTLALDLVGFGIILPVLPLYAERFGARPTTIGLLLASFSVAQLVFAPLWGWVSDRIGRKPVLLVSLFGSAVGSLLTGAAGSVGLLFVGRIIDGASGASVSVAQAAVTDVAEPAERAHLLGLLGAAFGLGFVVGPALGALASLGGAHVPFYLAAALSAANGVVAVRRLPETRPGSRRGVPGPLAVARPGRPAASGPLVHLAVIGFLGLVAFSGFEATFALFAARRFDLGIGGIGAVFAAVGVALVVVQGGLIRPLVARLGARSVLRLGLGANLVGMVLLARATGWPVLVAGLAGLVLGQGLVSPTLSALVAERARDDRRGSALGMQQLATGLARVAGPAAAARLFDVAGVPGPYVAGAVVVLAALLVALVDGPAGARSARPAR